MSAAKPCQQELTEASTCIQQQPSSDCFCFGDDFATEFPRRTRFSYNQVQAFITKQDPRFCDFVNQAVCNYYNINNACCCQERTEKYRRCLVETIFPFELVTKECQNDCSTLVDLDSGISSSGLVGIIGGSLFLVMAVAYFISRHSELKKATQPIPEAKDNSGPSIESKREDQISKRSAIIDSLRTLRATFGLRRDGGLNAYGELGEADPQSAEPGPSEPLPAEPEPSEPLPVEPKPSEEKPTINMV